VDLLHGLHGFLSCSLACLLVSSSWVPGSSLWVLSSGLSSLELIHPFIQEL
jgi:hypothetical protein